MGHATSKSAKEAFFAGHSGTSLMEINQVVGLVPLAALLFAAVQSVMRQHGVAADGTTTGAKFRMQRSLVKVRHLAEMCAMVLPQIAVMMDLVAPPTAAATAVVLVLIVICNLFRKLLRAPRDTRIDFSLQAARSIGNQRARYGKQAADTCGSPLSDDARR